MDAQAEVYTDSVEAVQRMQDYIEQHAAQPITLRALADAAGYSPYHSARMFKELTGRPPFEYIRLLRLTRAALRLRDGRARVLDVALDFEFGSHEGFTRAFSRHFGIPPGRYSRETPPISLFYPYGVRDSHRSINRKGEGTMSDKNSVMTVFVQIVERPERKLLLKRGVKATEYFEYCEEVGCDIWGVLCSVKEALYEPVGMWLPRHMITTGTSQYVQAVELPIDYCKPVPDGFELITLPPCKMMMFQSEPYDDERMAEVIGQVWAKIDAFNPEIYGCRWAPEDAPRFQLSPMGCRGYIEARPVREVTGNK